MTVFANRIYFATATTGTGTINVGAALTSYETPTASGIASGSTVGYCIIDGTNWEVGSGVLTTGTPWTMTRAVVENSSAGGTTLLSLSGLANVFLTATAAQMNALAPLASPTFSGTVALPAASVASGINFGSQLGASINDLSKQIELYSTTYGLGITSGSLNYVVGLGGIHNFVVNGSPVATISSTAVTGPTQAATDNSTNVATTAFVTAAVAPAFNDVGRNKLHNPLFNIAQRGTGPFTTVVNTLDRWALSFTGDTDSVTQVALADADRSAIGDEEAVFCIQNACTGVNSAANFSVLIQRIENVRRLGNKTVTVSFWAKAASGTPKIGVSIDQSFGTGGSPSTAVAGNGTAFTLSTTWTRYSGQFTIASTSGKTLGTAGDFTGLDFWFSSGSTNATRAGTIGVQTATFSLWGVQLEIGSVLSPLEKIDPRLDLANCQRFYQVGSILSSTTGTTAATLYCPMSYPVVMRASPTVTGANNSSTNVTTPTAVVAGTGATTQVIATGTCTASGPYILQVTYTASADL